MLQFISRDIKCTTIYSNFSSVAALSNLRSIHAFFVCKGRASPRGKNCTLHSSLCAAQNLCQLGLYTHCKHTNCAFSCHVVTEFPVSVPVSKFYSPNYNLFLYYAAKILWIKSISSNSMCQLMVMPLISCINVLYCACVKLVT